MQTYMWVITAVFALLTATYITLKLKRVGARGRGAVKMITSLTFLSVGVIGAVTKGGANVAWLIVGLFFASLGDLFLVFLDKRNYFIAGIVSFSLASLTFSVYSIVNYGFNPWTTIPFVLFVLGIVFCQIKKVFDFGSLLPYLNAYTLFVGLCGSLGVFLAFVAPTVAVALFGVGCVMYFASDMCLGLYMFKFRNRWVDALNSLLYFPGLFLIALSAVI